MGDKVYCITIHYLDKEAKITDIDEDRYGIIDLRDDVKEKLGLGDELVVMRCSIDGTNERMEVNSDKEVMEMFVRNQNVNNIDIFIEVAGVSEVDGNENEAEDGVEGFDFEDVLFDDSDEGSEDGIGYEGFEEGSKEDSKEGEGDKNELENYASDDHCETFNDSDDELPNDPLKGALTRNPAQFPTPPGERHTLGLGEGGVFRRASVVRCGICRGVGHNRSTCPKRLQPEGEVPPANATNLGENEDSVPLAATRNLKRKAIDPPASSQTRSTGRGRGRGRASTSQPIPPSSLSHPAAVRGKGKNRASSSQHVPTNAPNPPASSSQASVRGRGRGRGRSNTVAAQQVDSMGKAKHVSCEAQGCSRAASSQARVGSKAASIQAQVGSKGKAKAASSSKNALAPKVVSTQTATAPKVASTQHAVAPPVTTQRRDIVKEIRSKKLHDSPATTGRHPVKPNPVGYFRKFKDGGLVDSRYVTVSEKVLKREKPRYRTRKGTISVNVLGVVDIDMKFVYVFPGWEGSDADSRVLRDTVHRPNGLHVPTVSPNMRSSACNTTKSNGSKPLTDNGFRVGYLNHLVDEMTKVFPGTNHDHWLEIFGKDRANGGGAEDCGDAVNAVNQEQTQIESQASPNFEGVNAYTHTLDEHEVTSIDVRSMCSQLTSSGCSKKTNKGKRKLIESIAPLVKALDKFTNKADARLGKLTHIMTHEHKLSTKKEAVYETVSGVDDLTLQQKLVASNMIVKNHDVLELFFILPDETKGEQVRMMLNGKL
ncbi:hypothetical protein BUALT_Bualt12G0139500 [Buddleja alternifolia]|uniref:Transposase n=1 Tax=Buddleja alternifolia TaxID=168488 RepID=A0AAV6WXF7_9LAMI|nr:hypothetical protein BUALT_Bualt12G0139500 [Buddleja alternifolia]